MKGLVEMRNKENINTISLEHLKELRKNIKEFRMNTTKGVCIVNKFDIKPKAKNCQKTTGLDTRDKKENYRDNLLIRFSNKYGILLDNELDKISSSGGFNPDNTVPQIKYLELLEMIQTDLENLINNKESNKKEYYYHKKINVG